MNPFQALHPNIPFTFSARVHHHDEAGDPICVLEITFDTDEDALFYKMWRE